MPTKGEVVRIVGFTHSLEDAQELCSMEQTHKPHGKNKWFYGYTSQPPQTPSKQGYPSARDLIKSFLIS